MIYSVILVDGDSGILLLENQLKELEKKQNLSSDVLAGFFKALNNMIDEIQVSMKKGRDVSNMIRSVESEGSLIIIYYHPQSRVMICSISDPDDDRVKIIELIKILGKRFWLKHQADIDIFRKENIRDIFNSFSVDIDTYSLEGKVAESFPKLMVALKSMNRIKMMGVVSELEYKVAKLCDGKTSSLKISKDLQISLDSVKRCLNKLEDVDIIKIL